MGFGVQHVSGILSVYRKQIKRAKETKKARQERNEDSVVSFRFDIKFILPMDAYLTVTYTVNVDDISL